MGNPSSMIPYGCQDITAEDCNAVVEVLKSAYLTQGPTIQKFEESVAAHSQAKNAVAFSSATAALHAAYHAVGIGPGSTVWTSPNTFVSTANAARMLGAAVDFVDIDSRTYNISIDSLERKLKQAQQSAQLPDLLVPVHFAGQSCDMEAIAWLSEKYGFRVVEDAAHAIGGRYKDEPVGSCKYSDIAVFSFHPVKIITTGEGGVATTNDVELQYKLESFRTHGITRDSRRMLKEPDGGWYYEMQSLGYNYRLTDIQAALGLSQLERVEGYIDRRHKIAAVYNQRFSDLSIVLPYHESWQYSAWHLYPIQWIDQTNGLSRREVFDALWHAGIGVNVHYIPVHLQPYYQQLGFRVGDFPISENYYRNAITLPLHPKLTSDQQEYIISNITELAQ